MTTGDAARVELYDIAFDALEAKDVSADNSAVVKGLLTKLEAWKTTLPERPSGAVFSVERSK